MKFIGIAAHILRFAKYVNMPIPKFIISNFTKFFPGETVRLIWVSINIAVMPITPTSVFLSPKIDLNAITNAIIKTYKTVCDIINCLVIFVFPAKITTPFPDKYTRNNSTLNFTLYQL